MLKKITQIGGSLLLILISFYYTQKTIDIIKYNDPIMKTLVKSKDKYQVKSTNAKIKDNTIISGINGKKVNLNESYKKMKRYGSYNDSLLVFREEKPTISIDDYYDKYIVGANNTNNIALVFKVERADNIDLVLDTLQNNNVNATFFIDGVFLENNQELVSDMSKTKHEIEILNYDYNYQEKFFKSSLNILESITNIKPKYCYALYDQKQIIELCYKLLLHTVKPSIIATNNPFGDIKTRLVGGSIIGLEINEVTIKQLNTIIDYIKQRGYTPVTIDVLLNEEQQK